MLPASTGCPSTRRHNLDRQARNRFITDSVCSCASEAQKSLHRFVTCKFELHLHQAASAKLPCLNTGDGLLISFHAAASSGPAGCHCQSRLLYLWVGIARGMLSGPQQVPEVIAPIAHLCHVTRKLLIPLLCTYARRATESHDVQSGESF